MGAAHYAGGTSHGIDTPPSMAVVMSALAVYALEISKTDYLWG
jgi:hypothetical protein